MFWNLPVWENSGRCVSLLSLSSWINFSLWIDSCTFYVIFILGVQGFISVTSFTCSLWLNVDGICHEWQNNITSILWSSTCCVFVQKCWPLTHQMWSGIRWKNVFIWWRLSFKYLNKSTGFPPPPYICGISYTTALMFGCSWPWPWLKF